jgi:hypothetical protein
MAGDLTVDAAAALEALKSVLARLEIDYAIGGSVASSFYGEPRSTHDIDLLVELPPQRFDEFVAALRGSFYVPVDSAREAIRVSSMFNIVHLPTKHKFDLYPSRGSPLDRDEFARRQLVSLSPDGASPSYLGSAETIILRKLDWYRRGNCVADQWRDVLGVLKSQSGRLDLVYLKRMATSLQVEGLLERALLESE